MMDRLYRFSSTKAAHISLTSNTIAFLVWRSFIVVIILRIGL
ncbi:hypothetical protein OQJ19_13965 [Fluoribacter gormanii]|nr:hypothetical protein [Fluoribacter gormanii]MCW8471743.1 hypothetical protein [Fluoribacter gormanii]